MLILGIESSCDETSVSIVDDNKQILSNFVYSQAKLHSLYGGVIPEVAAREHGSAIIYCLKSALLDANINIMDLSGIAVTAGPGLIGGLLVGITTAEALSIALNKPIIAINHMEGHLLTPRLTHDIIFPYLALLISGGHSEFIVAENINNYKILGRTLDDAVGEAFDKVARLLGIKYPGGQKLEQLSLKGEPDVYKFKPPLLHSKTCDLSFSGLKTASANLVAKLITQNSTLSAINKANIALAFTNAVVDSLKAKSMLAINHFKQHYPTGKSFVISGGVAANLVIRQALKNLSNDQGLNFVSPPLKLCGDNAAMIAWAGIEKLKSSNNLSYVGIKAMPNWKLEQINKPNEL